MKIQDILAKSIEFFENKLQLKNDLETPGSDKYYGTDVIGVKGYHDLPAEVELPTDLNAATPGNDKYYGTDGTGVKGYHDLPAEVELPTDLNAVAPGVSKYYGTDGTGVKGYHDLPAEVELPTDLNAVAPGSDKYYGTDGTGVKGYHDLSAAVGFPPIYPIIYVGSIERLTGTIISYDVVTGVLTGLNTTFTSELVTDDLVYMGPRTLDHNAGPSDPVFKVVSVLTDTTLEGVFYYGMGDVLDSTGLVFPYEHYKLVDGSNGNSGLTPFDGVADVDAAFYKCRVYELYPWHKQFFIDVPPKDTVNFGGTVNMGKCPANIQLRALYADENGDPVPIVLTSINNDIQISSAEGTIEFNGFTFNKTLKLIGNSDIYLQYCNTNPLLDVGLIIFGFPRHTAMITGGSYSGVQAAITAGGPCSVWFMGSLIDSAAGVGIIADSGAIVYTTTITNNAFTPELKQQFGEIREVTPPSM